MANPNQSEKSVALDREENITKGNLSAKKIVVYSYDSSNDQLNPISSRPLSDQITSTDRGLVTNTVIHGKTTAGGGSYVDVKVSPSGALQVEGDLTVSSGTYESRNDTTTDTNLVYLGKALPGSATSDAAWQIKRYNKSAGTMTFADDVTTFTKQWSERTTYGY